MWVLGVLRFTRSGVQGLGFQQKLGVTSQSVRGWRASGLKRVEAVSPKIEDFWESFAGISDLGVAGNGLNRLEIQEGSLKIEDLRESVRGTFDSAADGLNWLEFQADPSLTKSVRFGGAQDLRQNRQITGPSVVV